MEKTKIAIIILLAMVTVVFSGCVLHQGGRREQPPEVPAEQPTVQPPAQPAGITLEQQQDMEWMDKALQEQNAAHCDNIVDSEIQQGCREIMQIISGGLPPGVDLPPQ